MISTSFRRARGACGPLEEFPGAAQGPALVVEAAPYRPGDQAESEGATEFTIFHPGVMATLW